MPLIRTLLKRAGLDQRGSAAVEFALIAPVAILLYCGFAELTMAMMAERRAAHAASVVADLIAQQTTISKQQVLSALNIGNSIMYPFPTATMKFRVTSIVADVNGAPQPQWSQVSGGYPQMPHGTVSGFPANLLAAGDSVIQADIQYAFTSPLRMTLPTALTYKNTFYLKPRQSPSVTCADCTVP